MPPRHRMLPDVSGNPLSDEDRAIQDRARAFVDEELIPWEVHAEEHDGHIPDDAHARHRRMAMDLGFSAMNMPTELGRRRVLDAPPGPRLRTDRPGHERAGLVRPHAGRVGAGGHDARAGRPLAEARDHRHVARVLRDHGGGRRLRRRRDRGNRAPRRRRLRAQRREVARHVVQHRRPHLLPGEARGRGARRPARDVRAGEGHAGRPPGPRAALHAHVPRHARDRGVRGRADPRRPADRRRGRRHVVHVRLVPLRAPDDRGALLRRRRAADRGGDGVRQGAGRSSGGRSSRTRRSATCWPTRSPSCGRRG